MCLKKLKKHSFFYKFYISNLEVLKPFVLIGINHTWLCLKNINPSKIIVTSCLLSLYCGGTDLQHISFRWIA